MKVLQLRFENLNSLYGEHGLDFTRPEFVSEGIFAIVGPTGAGKSTILDALCLALYGATPRLGRITTSSNEIMSRQTGTCFAEAVIAAGEGTYRCHWSQHRARKKADGALQEARHEIAEAETGKVIEAQKKAVAAKIEALTGMDFERFTRSMLLAQGDFSAFLRASADERSPLLEQITGTAIYSTLSIRCHERHREERQRLEQLKAEISGIPLLSSESIQQFNAELAEWGKQKIVSEKQLLEIRQKIDWLVGINKLTADLASLEKERMTLAADIQAFEPDRERLSWARKATPLEGVFSSLTTLRQEQHGNREALHQLEENLPTLAEACQRKADTLEVKRKTLAACEQAAEALAPVLKQVRELDLVLNSQEKQKALHQADLDKQASAIRAKEKEQTDCVRALDKVDKLLKALDEKLTQNRSDELLVTQLAGMLEQLKQLQAQAQGLTEQEAALKKEKVGVSKMLGAVQKQSEAHAAAQHMLEAARAETIRMDAAALKHLAGRSLREYRAELDACWREQALLNKIASLESERTHLEDGKPCPLCGSHDHPYAEGNLPELNATEQRIEKLKALIEKAEILEQSLSTLKQKEQTCADTVQKAQIRLTELRTQQEHSQSNLQRLESECAKLAQAKQAQEQILLETLVPYGIEKLPAEGCESLIENLKQRVQQWRQWQAEQVKCGNQKLELSEKLKALQVNLDELRQAHTEKKQAFKDLDSACAQIQEKREKLFGKKKSDDEERACKQALDAARATLTQAQENYESAKRAHSAQATRITALRETLEKRGHVLGRQEAEFQQALTQNGFADETEFLARRLPAEARQTLESRAQALAERQSQLQTRSQERQERLQTERAKALTEDSIDSLEAQFKPAHEALQTLLQQMGAHKERLTQDAEARQRVQDKQEAILQQEKEQIRWSRLNQLIGASDGKKFRNFAQGLTFERMVAHANRQLARMTDRYTLVRDAGQPLELNVADHYQAGEIRSTKNLSGGESFLVSLALALGLSQMASRNVRVDSLFLDEGFGTLDEDALEMALSTLAGLHQEGKLIGIISHVSALKERIPTQIVVTPLSAGRSQLQVLS